jgi:hypothetical protein
MERRRSLGGAQTRYADGVARRHKPDYWILIISALLLSIGLVVIYSISPGLSASQHISQSYFVTKQYLSSSPLDKSRQLFFPSCGTNQTRTFS